MLVQVSERDSKDNHSLDKIMEFQHPVINFMPTVYHCHYSRCRGGGIGCIIEVLPELEFTIVA